jgi:hypothetical protein
MSTDTEIGISANAQPFTREMDRAAQSAITAGQRIQTALREAGANMATAMMTSLDKINDKAKGSIAVMDHYKGAIAAVGAVAGSIVAVAVSAKRLTDTTYEATHAAELLASKLGVSAAQGGVLAQAVDNVNSDTATLESGLSKVTQALDKNEEAFGKLGVATRDSNGNFRSSLDILQETNSKFAEFREGTDRNIEMQRIYGKSWQDMVPLLNLTAEAAAETEARMRELGLVIGEENVAAAHAYDDALDDVGMVMKGLSKAIGDALMPVLTKLGEWFSSIGPGAITITKGAVGGLTAAFWLLKNGVVVVWETINALVITVAEPVLALSRAMAKLAQGDFSGAWGELGRGGMTMVSAWKAAMAEIETSSLETSKKVWNLFAAPTAMPNQPGTGKTAGEDATGKPKGKPKPTAQGKTYSDAEWALEEQAWNNRTDNQLAEQRAEAEEAAFARATKAAEEWEADLERGSRGAAEDAKRSAEQRTQVEYLWAQNAAAAQLAVVDADEARARHAADTGLMTHAELLAQEAQFEQRRNEIRAQALQDRLALIDPEKDPVAYAQILVSLEELERQHQARIGAIKLQAAAIQAEPMKNIWAGIEQSLAGSLQRLMTLQTTFGGFMRSLWQGIGNAVIGEITRIMAKEAVAWAAKRIKTIAGIGMDAARAGSGAAASQASIPYVGPGLALAAMASVSAAVAGMSSMVPSAAQGYDIPAGINPLTQLHEQEMVLPRGPSNTVRSLEALPEMLAQTQAMLAAGGPAAGDTHHWHVNAIDAQSFERFAQSNARVFAGAVKAAVRDGYK